MTSKKIAARSMRRKLVLLLIVLLSITVPLAEAQQQKKMSRVGIFHVGLDHVPGSLERLREGLKAFGYEEGINIHLDWRNLPDDEAARRRRRSSLKARWT